MKKLIAATLTIALAGLAAYAQGTVNFANGSASPPLQAPIFAQDGTTKLSGAGFTAVLLAGPSATSLSQVATSAFSTGGGAGFFFGGTQIIPGVAGGATAFILIEAFNTASGSTFAQAKNSADQNAWGWSGNGTPFQVTTGNPNSSPPGTPAVLVGLTSFNLQPGVGVPEPSSLALAGLGAAALLIFRRRK